jgi:hypothetical protein
MLLPDDHFMSKPFQIVLIASALIGASGGLSCMSDEGLRSGGGCQAR